MTNSAKTISQIDGKTFLQQAFAKQQKMLKTQLEMSSTCITHNGVMGEVSEQHFIDIIQDYLPKRYTVNSGIVIDSNGETSDQIDVIIYDKQYTPTLLDQQNHRFIPAESVYAVFEVKPYIDKPYLVYAGEKAESVKRLKRTSVPIYHAGGITKPKQHFDIVTGIVATHMKWKNGFGTTFENIYWKLPKINQLDCGLAVSGACFDRFNANRGFTYGPQQNALIFFLFRLLQKLQSLGTVPAIDWNAYATQLTD
jgi:hypothetical protein